MLYLCRRNHTYYFRFRIPARLRQLSDSPEIKYSLHTTSYSEAVESVAPFLKAIRLIKRAREMNAAVESALKEIREPVLYYPAAQPVPLAQLSMPTENQEDSKLPPYLLSEAWSDFRAFKKDWSHKVIRQNERYYELMKCLWEDVDVRSINKRMIKTLLSRFQDFPRGNINPYCKLSVAELLELDAQSVADEYKVSGKLVKDLLKLCQSFFSAYLTIERGVYQVAPTSNVRYEAKSKSYASFSDTQVRRIKAKALTLDGWERWSVLLAIYTGARRGDITGLTKSSLRFDEDSQRYYLWISEGKTEAATRAIPIHKELIRNGFLEFVRASKTTLFPKLMSRPARMTHHVRELLDELEVPDVNDKGQRYSLHSFRHTFITKVQQCGVPTSLFQTVVGHQKSELGISKRYTHDFTVNALSVVMDAINDW
ncbi:tyrosine-type recombinase/integrase [Shewanella sp. A32]|uniref:DUF6538 domain-containing protein n=1 Tax=Shewanella sp. A32 TaxID=3031327 RepID=UPI0023B9B0B7|nr:DUF6538 domain-containing protein [Shewanella sp. A32]MDF0535021.1 tyrosine-type recombinase/integrase [Shewanella sp. A32]